MRLILFFAITFSSLLAKSQLLLPFHKAGKWGYINTQCEVIIEPRFEAAKPFYHGMAAVRQDGLYGFINGNGDWVKNPEYEHTEGFYFESSKNSLQFIETEIALVYKNGLAILINHQFEEVYHFAELDSESLDWDFFENEIYFYLSKTAPAKSYLLSSKLDSVQLPSASINFKSGPFLAFMDETYDSPGIFRVSDQSYSVFKPRNGYAAEFADNFIFEYVDTSNSGWQYFHSLDGELVDSIDTRVYDIPKDLSQIDRTQFTFKDSVGVRTELLMIGEPNIATYDSTLFLISPIDYYGRQTFYLKDGRYIIHKRGFEPSEFDRIYNFNSLTSEFIAARREGEFILVDTSLNEYSYPIDQTDFFFHYKDDYDQNKSQFTSLRCSFTKPSYQFINLNTGFVSQTLYSSIKPFIPNVYIANKYNGDFCYLLANGKEIDIPFANEKHDLNIDFQIQNRIFLLDQYRKEGSLINLVNNFSIHEIAIHLQDRSVNEDDPDSLWIEVNPQLTNWNLDPNINAYEVSLINSSNDTFFLLPGVRTHLKTEVQAKDVDGSWISLESPIEKDRHMWPIEFLPHSQWTWTIPKFEGTFETELRVVVYGLVSYTGESYIDQAVLERLRESKFELYSEPFTGSINPMQFSRTGYYNRYDYFQD